MVTNEAIYEITPNPGYCEFCGPNCSHCSEPETGWHVDGPVLAFDKSAGKWVCAADYDYEANRDD